MRLLVIVAGLVLLSSAAVAEEINVAVAANFTEPAEAIAAAFEADTGHEVHLSFGSTGALYAQITQGAPFEVFLAADDRRPSEVVTRGFGVEGTVVTYAIGGPALYSPSIDVTDGELALRAGRFSHIAIAEPGAAPYGAAAMEVLAALGLEDAIAPKIVTGENIGQTLQFVESGNAEVGFVALSQVADKPANQVWTVPAGLFTPIRQDAVLLVPGAENGAAMAFLDYLGGEAGAAIIKGYGYDLAD